MSDRKQHWDKIYTDNSPLEVSWFQKEPTLSLDMIENCLPDVTEPVIDIGGGASVLIDRLVERGYQYLSVLDISEKALQHSQSRLGNKASQIEWYVSDITEFKPPHTFSLWHDRAVFHFLTDVSDRKKYIDTLHSVLKPGGHLVLAAFAIGGPTQCSGLDIKQYDAASLADELGKAFMLVDIKSETHDTPSAKQQLFNYYHFTRP